MLAEVQQELDDQIAHVASGRVIAETTDETAMRVNRVAGVIEGLSYILTLEGEADEDE